MHLSLNHTKNMVVCQYGPTQWAYYFSPCRHSSYLASPGSTWEYIHSLIGNKKTLTCLPLRMSAGVWVMVWYCHIPCPQLDWQLLSSNQSGKWCQYRTIANGTADIQRSRSLCCCLVTTTWIEAVFSRLFFNESNKYPKIKTLLPILDLSLPTCFAQTWHTGFTYLQKSRFMHNMYPIPAPQVTQLNMSMGQSTTWERSGIAVNDTLSHNEH